MDEAYKDAERGERLQKVMAAAGVGSRRHCEDLIEAGAVAVNGEPVVTLPAWVDPERDRITVEGRPIRQPKRLVYVMLNKPRHTVTTSDDPQGRRTPVDLVQHPSGARLYPVGRLDQDTTGLLLLTNDGELANRLAHPRYGVHKTYHATVRGELDEQAVAELEQGLYLADRRRGAGARRTKPARITLLRRDRGKTLLEVTLREGRNRQVRRMLANVGYPVRKLRRIKIGPLKLKGLAVGEWRDLTAAELKVLRRAARQGGGSRA
jgi:pseudouridine synthase